MTYPFLVGAIAMGLVWAIGAAVERYHRIAKPAAVLATIALVAHAIVQLF